MLAHSGQISSAIAKDVIRNPWTCLRTTPALRQFLKTKKIEPPTHTNNSSLTLMVQCDGDQISSCFSPMCFSRQPVGSGVSAFRSCEEAPQRTTDICTKDQRCGNWDTNYWGKAKWHDAKLVLLDILAFLHKCWIEKHWLCPVLINPVVSSLKLCGWNWTPVWWDLKSRFGASEHSRIPDHLL